ncbi:uncharacterized protein BP5553_01191 [Venustampulla echinocandica]|uniref:Uncharacterized protein n=1 Tax=Venustampulla echinocandica TaxID=2656787 RepID=A0A370U0A0_9HELO|nr:uncharacterized protein BP5553_01191 [Venustampulla echinocandica]RDL41212.1 hypothetical protein BP5553_01191 [Venustampulla echinocandica]
MPPKKRKVDSNAPHFGPFPEFQDQQSPPSKRSRVASTAQPMVDQLSIHEENVTTASDKPIKVRETDITFFGGAISISSSGAAKPESPSQSPSLLLPKPDLLPPNQPPRAIRVAKRSNPRSNTNPGSRYYGRRYKITMDSLGEEQTSPEDIQALIATFSTANSHTFGIWGLASEGGIVGEIQRPGGSKDERNEEEGLGEERGRKMVGGGA